MAVFGHEDWIRRALPAHLLIDLLVGGSGAMQITEVNSTRKLHMECLTRQAP